MELPMCECGEHHVRAMVRPLSSNESTTHCLDCAIRECRAAVARGELLTIESHPINGGEMPDTRPDIPAPVVPPNE